MVPGFSSCLGVPRHVSDDHAFVTSAHTNISIRHDRILDLVEDIPDEDPLATLQRLLQVCGVNRFGNLISVVPPPLIHDFAAARDDVVTSTFAAIQQEPPPPDSTHFLGGACLTSRACQHSFVSRAPCSNGSQP
jgi:hypothetical protein